nr:hypothetical protein [Clostridia bacterium]
AILTACVTYDAVALGPEISTYSESFSTGAFKPKRKLNKRGILYIADIDNSISLQTATPVFSSVPRNIYKNIYFLGGWDSCSPAKNSILERFGYSSKTSPYRILAEDPQVFLLDSYRPQQKITFIREHYYPNASLAMYEAMGAQLIYSVSIEEFPAAEPSFSITDASVDFSEEYEGYYFVGASVDVGIGEGDTVYYELTDSADTVRTYQAQPIESDAGTGSLVLWIPGWDLPHGISGLSLRVIIRSGSSDSSSDSVTLF